MESLPLEVVEVIAQYLSAQDLAACCATSHSWRFIFNQDLFWKHLTNQETADYLSRTPCRVKPAFISPEVEGSGLDPVCRWRMNYMRENHLFDNWRSGRCDEESLKIKFFERRISRMLFYQEEFLITVTHSPDVSILIWDLRCDLALYVDNPCHLLKPSEWLTDIVIFGDRRFIVQESAVLVFQINLMKNIWPLKKIFFLEADEPTDFISAVNSISRITYLIGVDVDNILIVGNYFLAVQNSVSTIESHLQIWNIVNYSKSRRESFCNLRPKIKSSKTSLDAILVIFSMTDTDSEYKKVLVYSLFSFTYYPCVFEGAGYCSLHENKVVVNMKIPSEHWLIVNYKTGEQIFRIEEIDCLPNRSIEVLGNKLIYSTHSGLNQINLSSGEMKQFLHFRCDNNLFRVLKDKILWVEVDRNLGSYKILYPVMGKSISKRLETVYKKRKIRSVNVTNITLTKIIANDTLDKVITFW